MGHNLRTVDQTQYAHKTHNRVKNSGDIDFVLEKSIFNNVFEKDIQRVYLYKKAERLAKAIHMVAPAFKELVSLKGRLESIAVEIIDASLLEPGVAKDVLSRNLLTLSSILSIAETAGKLSHMNADLIRKEAHIFLHEIATYEEPRFSLKESPTLSGIAKQISEERASGIKPAPVQLARTKAHKNKGHIRDIPARDDTHIKDRQASILAVIRTKKTASIKDISTVIRTVSEKTIQRELASLIESGVLAKEGERRWSRYSLV